MTTLQEQWAQDNKTWWKTFSRFEGENFGRFSFLFANRWSTKKELVYYVSANGWITTEQFVGSLFQTIPTLKIKHATNFATQSASLAVIVVSELGQLYAANTFSWAYTDDGGAGKIFPPDAPPFNFLGFGPLSADFESDRNNPNAGRRNSRFFVPALRPVIGDTESFQDVRFLETAFCSTTCIALSEQGHLWYSGNAHVDFIEPSSSFPGGVGALNYFRESQVTQYIDASGTVSPESPVTFQHIWATGALQYGAVLALATDGKLLMKGRFNLGKERQSRTFYEVSGFVDSMSLTAGGSGYTSTPGVTVSAPENADGTRATVSAVVSGGAVTELRITNSGWGYTAAPTVTFSGGGGTGAAASATLFDDTWQDADIASQRGGYLPTIAAVSSGGTLYAWGDRVLNPNNNSDATQAVPSPQRIRNQTHSDYVSVALVGDSSGFTSFGAALTSDGTLETWGSNSSASSRYTPDKTNQNNLTVYATDDVFVKIQGGHRMMALLTDDGRVFTYGNNLAYTGRANSTGSLSGHLAIGQIDGDAVWKDIFLLQDSMILVRDEEVDRLGNRVSPLPPISGPYTFH
jgi:hypothetical protein